MAVSTKLPFWCAGCSPSLPSASREPDEPADSAKVVAKLAVEEPGISLLDAARSGAVAVSAEANGDGRMTIKVANQTNKKLKVVLPPGLIATSATGQMGGGMGGWAAAAVAWVVAAWVVAAWAAAAWVVAAWAAAVWAAAAVAAVGSSS